MISIEVRAGPHRHDVLIDSDLLPSVGEVMKKILRGPRSAIISDKNVAPLFADHIIRSLKVAGFEPTLITVPPGERSKSLEQAGAICEQLARSGFDRSSFVIALGGGVVGDLAGFVAAIYHRGIPYVQVPTTLLAQVDSSIGGKTAVNTTAGKNLIGAFHHPVLVIADVDTLRTLPPRELNQGFAEIIKHAIIRDATLFEEVAQLSKLRSSENASWKLAPQNLELLVRRNVELKAEIVAADERDETGQRALLNFGHTVGHAIEQAGDYRALLHGEAISLGIVAACNVSVQKAGLPEAQRTKIIALLEKFSLPTHLPQNISRDKILRALPFDKKFERGQVRFIVTPAIGSARIASDVTLDEIRETVERL
ncbi:MAG: 3-dehydroquinate synthase [Verrucomicrobiota bacterium]|nr:3-dehydroquinate synthase [Verrucomicrobiota bacterium]